MPRKIGMKNMNISSITVIIAGTIVFTAFGLGVAIFHLLVSSDLVVFDSNRLIWLTHNWFRYASSVIAIFWLLVALYFHQPPGQRYRFQASALHWSNLWHGFLIAVRAGGNLVRNNVPADIFVAWGAVAIGMMWLGDKNDVPELRINGALLTLAWFYLFVWLPLIARERVVLVGVLPAYGVMCAYWIPEVVKQTDTPVQFILLPMAPALLFLFIWIPAQYLLLWWRKKCSSRPVLGPFVETLTFTLLAAPWLAAAYFFPAIFIDQHYQPISLCATIITGLVWSKLISDPFAKFVRSIL